MLERAQLFIRDPKAVGLCREEVRRTKELTDGFLALALDAMDVAVAAYVGTAPSGSGPKEAAGAARGCRDGWHSIYRRRIIHPWRQAFQAGEKGARRSGQ